MKTPTRYVPIPTLTREHFLHFNEAVLMPAILTAVRKAHRPALAKRLHTLPPEHLYTAFRVLSGMPEEEDLSDTYVRLLLESHLVDIGPALQAMFDALLLVWYTEDGPDLYVAHVWGPFAGAILALSGGKWPETSDRTSPVLAFIERETGLSATG